jgi:two-component system sensor kinase FixL
MIPPSDDDAPPTRLHDLRVADARWQAVLATARDAIVSINASGAITLFNPAAEQMFGYRAVEVLGRNVAVLMGPPYAAEHDDYIRRYRRTGQAKAIGRIRSVHAKRRSGEIFPIELSVSESQIDGDVLYTAIIRDMTERLAQQRELRDLQRAAQERGRLAEIGAITAKIVHDLGNPLAALSMQAQLILRRARRGDLQPAALIQGPAEQILQTLRRLEGLVHEFTDFAREQRLDLHPLQLAAVLHSSVELWRALALERGVQLTLEAVPDLPPLRADEVMLRRVLDNLIKNAIEAVDSGPGEVALSAEVPSAGKVVIRVEDTGPGIPEGLDVFKLFETTKREGTGIGLAVAKQIVVAHGGSIGHRPRHPRGTVFRVELPIAGPTRVHDGVVDR